MEHIAWIGTGVMGKPMAMHLRNAGYPVKAYNRTFSKTQALEPEIIACSSIYDCVKDADIVFSIVGFPNDVKEVYSEVFKHAKKGAILIDMTTSSPLLAKELSIQANALGYMMLDAPVTGGDIGAINASLSIMVGGNINAYDKILPLFNLLGKRITYMGESGNGQHAKLANQIVIAGNIAAIAESLLYTKNKNLDQNSMLSVITGGSAASWQAQVNGAKMISGDYNPGFFIKHFLKDLKLIIEEKERLKLDVVERIEKIYQWLSDEGMNEYGTQAIIEYYLRNNR
jgi:3-hydroxyisobutyrate dehydrogenase